MRDEPVLPDHLRMTERVSPNELSAHQRYFAERQEAIPGPRGAMDGVFLYHVEASITYRWLVDSDGRAIERAVFHRSPE